LNAVAERVLREVPGTALALDSAGRITDIAVDHAEHHRLAPDEVQQVVALMREEGLFASVSSIHVNGWLGDHDKLSGARWALRHRLGRELDAEREHWIYVGDSANDQVMFRAFPLSVGVANLRHGTQPLAHWPAYITEGERGDGFAEVARALLSAKAGTTA
jgi:hydroxymethylpyrimidine pyrophosphatase-like HAD family hydrolase